MGIELDKIQLEKVLEALKSPASLSPYSLTLYRRQKREGVDQFQNCCSRVTDRLCRDMSRLFFENDLENYFREGTPTVCRFGGGFFGFVVPFRLAGEDFCLVGDGVRDHSIDLWQLAAFSRSGGGEIFALFPQVEALHTASFEEVDAIAHQVARQIGTISLPGLPAERANVSPVQSDTALKAVAAAMVQIDVAKTVVETLLVCCETIGAQFKVERVAVAVRDGAAYQVCGILGMPDTLGTVPAGSLDAFLSRDKVKKTVPYDARMRGVLPGLQATLCTSFPFLAQGEQLGFLALVDCDPSEGELLLISMLAHATATRMAQIVKEAEQSKANAFSGGLMSLANTLLQVEGKDELYEAILGMAADLIDATQGSIMLIDKNGENMHIVFTLGMTLNIARCIPMKVGRGIAGKVAQTGEPLLVNDVEIDSRIAMVNRPRFKSKSLICIPLKLKEKIIGVINLSDKKNLAPFSSTDLQLLTSFANLASLMIERTLVLEQSVKFEQLSVTDSLTGLYNRRFLKSRFDEELNRSLRQNLALTVLFIDLDFFKNYNDICGHLAGDDALKTTADIIRESLRDMDIVARYGGEEFCAVLPGTSKSEAFIVAERIRAEIENKVFPGECNLPSQRLTASLGVATFPEDGRTFTTLVHASDMALYQAKANGRNRIVAATPPVPPTSIGTGLPSPESSPPQNALDFSAYLDALNCIEG